MDFLESVKLGIEKAPRQCFGSFIIGLCSQSTEFACILGAAWLGIGSPQIAGNMGTDIPDTLLATFPILNIDVKLCPECRAPLVSNVINLCVHLNDTHRWSRLRIAEWVVSL